MTEALEGAAGRTRLDHQRRQGRQRRADPRRVRCSGARLRGQARRSSGHLAGRCRPGGRSTPPSASARRRASFTRPGPISPSPIGRLTTPYIRRLKRQAGLATYTIILQNPKVPARTADLFWVPEHDTRRGPNVITTLTAPHSFTARRLAELRASVPPEIAGAAAAARCRHARRPERGFPLHASGAGAARLRRCSRSVASGQG